MYIYIHTYIHTYIHIYIYIYTHMYIHMYIYRERDAYMYMGAQAGRLPADLLPPRLTLYYIL